MHTILSWRTRLQHCKSSWFINLRTSDNLWTCTNQGRRQIKKNVGTGVNSHGERGARAYNGSLGRSPQRGPGASGGRSPFKVENVLVFGCPTEAANMPHYQYFANSLNPRYLWYICCQTNWRYRPCWHGQYCVLTEKQFVFVVLVMCEVSIQSKSAQIAAPNVYWKPH